MAQFIFVYLGGEYPTDPAEAQKHLNSFQQWLVSLGDAVVNPAIPFKDTHTVQPDGTASQGTMSSMSGIGIMKFGSMQEAVAAAQSCPFLEISGTLEISEMIEMSATSEGGSESIN